MIRRVSQELSSSPDLDRPKLGLSEASGMRATMKGVRLQALAFGKEACKDFTEYPRSSDGHVHGSCSL